MGGAAWWKEFDARIEAILPAWDNVSDAKKDDIFGKIFEMLSPDNETLRELIKALLDDGKFDEADVAALIEPYVKKFVPDSVPADDFAALLISLSAGKLTTREIAVFLATALSNRVTDQTLKKLIKAAGDGTLDKQIVEDVILEWVRDKVSQSVHDLISHQLHVGRLRLEDLTYLVVGMLINAGKAPTGLTNADAIRAKIVDMLKQKIDIDGLDEAIEAASKNDHMALLKLLLTKVGLAADEEILKLLLKGQADAAAKKFLMDFLKRSGLDDKQANAVAGTLMDLLKGKFQLVPRQTEMQGLGMDPKEYNVFLRVRKVLYAVLLALRDGPRVPATAMGGIHILAAAKLRAEIELNTLVTGDQADVFVVLVNSFIREEFKDELLGKSYPAGKPLNQDSLLGGDTVFSVHFDISGVVLP